MFTDNNKKSEKKYTYSASPLLAFYKVKVSLLEKYILFKITIFHLIFKELKMFY